MKQFTTLKRIWSLFLTLAMAVSMGVTTLPAYAATGGKISVKYELNGVTLKEPAQFELYKVGNFGHTDEGKVSIDLTPDFATCPISLNDIAPPKKDAPQQDIDNWNNAWLEKARYLEQWIKALDNKPATAWEGKLAAGSTPQTLTENGAAKTFNNGIYLLIGYEQREVIGEKDGEHYWSPVPVLIKVLDKDVTFEIVSTDTVVKTVKRPVAYKHVLKKSWNDKGHEDARPESVEVEIKYGITENILSDTVTLSKDNNWTYVWYSQEAEENRIYTSKGVTTALLNDENGYTVDLPEGDGVWRVLEKDSAELNYYTVTLDVTSPDNSSSQQTDGSGQEPAEGEDDVVPGSPADVTEFFTLTNKFETKRVRIKKHLINYLNHNDGDEAYANATVVFDVKGYIGESTTPVYENQVGMTFTKPGNQEIVLNNIPVKVTRVVAKEIYNTNYKEVDGNYEITRDITGVKDEDIEGVDGVVIEEDPIGDGKTIKCITFIFEFENDYDGPPKYGSGIVNKYDKNDKGDYEYEPYPDTSDIFPPTQS